MTPPHAFRTLLAAAALCAAAPAMAQSCAGFTDVPSADPFCASVEWVRNRAVTQGCAPNLFCPNAMVPRREMAAFLARLGQALEPVLLHSADAATPVIIDLTGPLFANVVCQAPPGPSPGYAVTGFPRRASLQGFLSGSAVADQTTIVDLVVSFDGGLSWQLTRNAINGATFPAVGAASVVVFGDVDVDVGQSVRFGIAATATSAQNAPSLSAYCGLRVELHSRTGPASPFDAVPLAVDAAARAAGAFPRTRN